MKKLIYLVFLSFLLQSCWYTTGEDDVIVDPIDYQSYEPITQTREEFDESLKLLPARPVVESGKLYIKDDLLYIIEKGKGFHIFDNTDPAAPVPLSFIEVPLSTDLAIRDNVLYTHHAVDLVAFSYSNATKTITVLHREQNAFPSLISPEGLPAEYYDVAPGDIVVGYKLKEE